MMTVGSLWWDTDTHIHRGKKISRCANCKLLQRLRVRTSFPYICRMLWFNSHSLFSATLLFPFIKIWRDNETLKHHDNRTQTHANICIIGVCVYKIRAHRTYITTENIFQFYWWNLFGHHLIILRHFIASARRHTFMSSAWSRWNLVTDNKMKVSMIY